MPRRSSDRQEVRSGLGEFREAWDTLRQDYLAGTNTKFMPAVRGVMPMGSGADYHTRNERAYYYMMERARYFDRDNLVVKQGINRLVANVLQDGFSLDVQTEDKGLNKALGEQWFAWSNDPTAVDVEGEKSFHALAGLALRHRFVDGDSVQILTDDGQIQFFEAHRIKSPTSVRSKNTVLGVRMSPLRKRLAYLVAKEDIDPNRQLGTLKDVEEYGVRDAEGFRILTHVYDPDRASQTRGITAFATLCYALSMHDDLQFATLVKAQVASCFAVLRELEKNAAPMPALQDDPAAVTGATRQETQEDGTVRTIAGIAPGMDVRGNPGEKLHMASPNIPSAGFFEHAALILTFVAINLDMPLQVFLLDPTKTNFSGWRGAVDQMRIRMRAIQRYMIERFYCPVYRWKVRQFIQQDRTLRKLFAKHGQEIFAHTFNPPTWPYIEPLKDAQADTLKGRENLLSYRRIMAAQGIDGEDHMTECVDDRAARALYSYQKAQELNAANPGLEVTWRELAGGEFLESKVVNSIVAAREKGENEPEPADSDKETADA